MKRIPQNLWNQIMEGPCLLSDDEAMIALVEGRLRGRRRRELELHLAHCEECREVVGALKKTHEQASVTNEKLDPRPLSLLERIMRWFS